MLAVVPRCIGPRRSTGALLHSFATHTCPLIGVRMPVLVPSACSHLKGEHGQELRRDVCRYHFGSVTLQHWRELAQGGAQRALLQAACHTQQMQSDQT